MSNELTGRNVGKPVAYTIKVPLMTASNLIPPMTVASRWNLFAAQAR